MRLVFARSVAAWSVAVSLLQPVERSSELVQRIRGSAQFAVASAFIDGDYDRFVNELVALTEIPAPPFKEQARAKVYLEMLRREGLSDVEIDAEGNAMGVRKGTTGGSMLAVLAHLDTVFPEGTDVQVKRQGTRLMAPGVGDNTRGLALMLAVVRAKFMRMRAAKFGGTYRSPRCIMRMVSASSVLLAPFNRYPCAPPLSARQTWSSVSSIVKTRMWIEGNSTQILSMAVCPPPGIPRSRSNTSGAASRATLTASSAELPCATTSISGSLPSANMIPSR